MGKAKNLKARVNSHFKDKTSRKEIQLTTKTQKIEYFIVESEFEALLLEAHLIKKHQPFFNIRAKDDKSPLFIKITISDEFPRVFLVRRENEKGNLYFGPFPEGRTARQIFQTLRKIFPFDSQKKLLKRACFWSHLGLCHPCPSMIKTLPKNKQGAEKKKYRKNIKLLINLLSRKSNSVRRALILEMKRAAESKNFEEAARLRDQIAKLNYLHQAFQPTQAFLENPALISDLRKKEQRALYLLLKDYLKLEKPPARIECFDASHISLTSPAVGMVTFINGEEEKNLYRRFKIKKEKAADDLAFLEEALTRRFRHSEWGMPDLLIIDGGKTQVGKAREVLKNLKISLPVVGLVKPFDNLVLPKNQGFLILQVKEGPAKRLLARLRDQAHRFALSYHRKLRAKAILSHL